MRAISRASAAELRIWVICRAPMRTAPAPSTTGRAVDGAD